jgi:hypothetical protein
VLAWQAVFLHRFILSLVIESLSEEVYSGGLLTRVVPRGVT